jgi:signal transduction histidine kinase
MLVVDDEPRNCKLIEGFLRSQGYAVESAFDGTTALRRIGESPPDVILLDVMMPGLTGYEVCAQVKADPATRTCQVMMVTALSDTANKVEGLDTGADDYISKPVQREEFLAKVRALLRARRLLDELEQARGALAARNEELQRKKTLAETLVHDLKSPLAAILGNLDLLRLKGSEEVQQLVQRSRRGADRMLKMVMNLLDIEALDEGRLKPDLQRIDVVPAIAAAIEEAEVPARQQGARLEIDAPGECWIVGDSALLRRVLDNLIANAITHSPPGGTIEVTVCPSPQGVEISVADEGPGIPEEFREKVFDKYQRLNTREAGAFNRGLGLTFCRLAIEAHGGTIWIDDAPGGGARFRAILADASSWEPEEPARLVAEV